MREIKFRAWDPVRKRMFTHPKWVEFRVDLSGRLLAFNYDRDRNEQELVVLQYIGIKDKNNGKDVYEGDVIEAKIIEYGSLCTMGVIEYDSTLACWCSRNDAGFTPLYKLSDIEVIGNIYENPELLSIDQSA